MGFRSQISSLTALTVAGNVAVTGGKINSQQPQTLLQTFAWPAGGGSAGQAIDPTTQALWLGLSAVTGSIIPTVTVTGTTTGIVYFQGRISPNDWALCPVAPNVDANVTITVGGALGGEAGTLSVVARQDPIVSYLAGTLSPAESNRLQPVYPSVGSQVFASAGATGANVALLGAPPANQQYQIWHLAVWGNHATATSLAIMRIQSSIGATPLLGTTPVGGGGVTLTPAAGILLGPEGLTLVAAASVTAQGSVSYSLVPR